MSLSACPYYTVGTERGRVHYFPSMAHARRSEPSGTPAPYPHLLKDAPKDNLGNIDPVLDVCGITIKQCVSENAPARANSAIGQSTFGSVFFGTYNRKDGRLTHVAVKEFIPGQRKQELADAVYEMRLLAHFHVHQRNHVLSLEGPMRRPIPRLQAISLCLVTPRCAFSLEHYCRAAFAGQGLGWDRAAPLLEHILRGVSALHEMGVAVHDSNRAPARLPVTASPVRRTTGSAPRLEAGQRPADPQERR